MTMWIPDLSAAARARALMAAGALGVVVGCGDDAETTGPAPPAGRPAHVVNEQKTHEKPYVDAPFQAETVTHFRTTDVLPDVDARRLAIVGGRLHAGTASGLVRLREDGKAFESVTVPGTGPVVDLAVDGSTLLVARAAEVTRLDASGVAGPAMPAGADAVRAVAARTGDVLVGTDKGLVRLEAGGPQPIAGAQGFAVRDLAVFGDVVWMATAGGVERYDAKAQKLLTPIKGLRYLADDDVRALAPRALGKGALVATDKGLTVIEDAAGATLLAIVRPGLGLTDATLPTGDLRAVAESGGVTLVGHGIGATALGGGRKDHYHTERWILAEAVQDVALESDGTRWIATGKGISRIGFEEQTLAGRMERFEPLLDKHWRMDGFVADGANYADPWDLGAAPALGDFDNDGLWTQMNVVAWCMAYATTGDEKFYAKARKALDVMMLEIDVPAVSFEAAGRDRGFITRSLVRSDEGALFESKKPEPNWHLEEHDGKTYYWKDDTSSDEYTGHFFGFPVFYDLCAKGEAERAAIRERIDRVMRYVVDNGLVLIDLDGEATTHGHWEALQHAVGGGGWLNSIEILGFLLATWHITRDDFFYDEYERLLVAEEYQTMIPVVESTFTVTNRRIANHSDHELASLAYFTLLRYEPSPERRALWLESIREFFEWERPERNPLEIAVMASALGDAEVELAAQTLREMPVDWREWLYDNEHREDVELDPEKDRHDQLQFKTVLPYDEIRTMKWNGNPYVVKGGGSGNAVQAPWPWLLPYWMLRYYGAIQ
jgi:hypothetical protein